MRFALSQPNAIDGEQLAAEIQTATGIALSRYDLIFYPPDQIEIREYTAKDRDQGIAPPGRVVGDIILERETIQAVIAAHNPNAEGTPRGRMRKSMQNTAQSAVGVHVDGLNRQQLDNLLRCLLFRAGALDDAGAVRPINEWL